MIKTKQIYLFFFLYVSVFSVVMQFSYAYQQKKAVAIANFENLSKSQEYDWIGTGFVETLTSKLVYVNSVRVVERSQIKEIINEQKLQMSGAVDQDTIVKCGFLEIEYMIVGSYQKSGNNLKVIARIIDIKNSKGEKSVEVEGRFNDLFAIQNELIIKISHAIGTSVSERERIKIAVSPTKNLIIYEWYTKGVNCYDKNEYDKSLEYYEKALKLSEVEKDEKIKPAIFNGIANIYAETSNYENAIEFYNKSLTIYEKIKNESDIATTYFNIGCIYKNQNDYNNAFVCFNKGLKLAERVRDEKLMAELYVMLGNIYRARNNYTQAIKCCEEALKVIEKLTVLGDLQTKSVCYAIIGDIHMASGKNKEAINYYNKSLDIIETGSEIKDKQLMALILYNMTVLYGKQAEYRIALYFANKALAAYQKIGDETSIQETQLLVKQLTTELEKKEK
ncbi:MAG: FlgO family outer membrane protein [Elusimicrobiota bacterium]